MYLLGKNQLDFNTIFNHELAPVVTSLFEDSGHARYSTSKSVLMNKIKAESSLRGVVFDAVIIDGGAMLHSSVHWPSEGTVNDFVSGIERYIEGFLKLSDVNVIFDRYFERSIKSDTRNARIWNFRNHITFS